MNPQTLAAAAEAFFAAVNMDRDELIALSDRLQRAGAPCPFGRTLQAHRLLTIPAATWQAADLTNAREIVALIDATDDPLSLAVLGRRTDELPAALAALDGDAPPGDDTPDTRTRPERQSGRKRRDHSKD